MRITCPEICNDNYGNSKHYFESYTYHVVSTEMFQTVNEISTGLLFSGNNLNAVNLMSALDDSSLNTQKATTLIPEN